MSDAPATKTARPPWLIDEGAITIVLEGKFKKVIGKGGFGMVYEGTFRGKRVAVKQVRIAGPKEETALTAEIHFSMQISQHPNIVKCYGGFFNTDNSEGTMVLEYLPKNLRDMAGATSAEKARLSLQVAEGIAYLHGQDCTHRDIKPENVMIGEDTLAKLIDFGLAKSNRMADNEVEMSEDVSARSESRATGLNRGTLSFMAPELLARDSAGGTRSVDTYAYGILLFEFWTGQPAFPGDHNDFQFATRLKYVSSSLPSFFLP
jgi:serine/threonine protein kinase